MKGLREIVLIHDLKKQGLSISAIARKVGCDRKTVRKHLERGLESPVYGPRAPRDRIIEPFERYLQERVQAFPDLSGARLLREFSGRIGLDESFTIHDRGDSEDLMGLVRHEIGLTQTAKRFPLKGTCLSIYSRVVNAREPLDLVLQSTFPWCVEWEGRVTRNEFRKAKAGLESSKLVSRNSKLAF